jgi:hypothetical protein
MPHLPPFSLNVHEYTPNYERINLRCHLLVRFFLVAMAGWYPLFFVAPGVVVVLLCDVW